MRRDLLVLESWMSLRRKFGYRPRNVLPHLGPLVDFHDIKWSGGLMRFRFMVHITFEGNSLLCDWGQKVQSTFLSQGLVCPHSSGARQCGYGNAADAYCTDDYRPNNVSDRYMKVTKTDVWWYDAPGLYGLNNRSFNAPGRPADRQGVYFHIKFKAWASPNEGAVPDCCTRCFEVNMTYDGNQLPSPNPGGEPALTGEVSPCPPPHDTCDPDDPNR